MVGWKPEVTISCSLSLPFSSVRPNKRQEIAKQQACIPSKQHQPGGVQQAHHYRKILKPSTISMPFQHPEHTCTYATLGGFKMGPVPQR